MVMKRLLDIIENKYLDEILFGIYGVGTTLLGFISKLSILCIVGLFFLTLLLLKIVIRSKQRKSIDNSIIEKNYRRQLRYCHGIGLSLLPYGLIIIILAVSMIERKINYLFSKPITIINIAFVFYYSINAFISFINNRTYKTVFDFIKNEIKIMSTIMSVLVLQLTRFNYIFNIEAIENYDVTVDGLVGCLVGVSIIIVCAYMMIYQGKDDMTFKNVKLEKINIKQKYFFSFLFAVLLLAFTIIMTSFNIFDFTDNLLIKMIIKDNTKLVPPWVESLMYGICIFSSYISLNFHEKRLSSVITIVLALFSFLFIVLISLSGYHFHFFAFIVCVATMVFTFVFQEIILGKLNNKKIESTLNMYVDSNVVEEMSKVRQRNMRKEITRKQIVVLFVDIRGFTSYSENNDPAKVVEKLNKYLSMSSSIIQKWGGTLDKYIGDAVMAIFNAPNDLNDYVYNAVCAAKEIIEQNNLSKSKLDLGIGINKGEAIVGNIGSNTRMNYTAIGDVVNTASRLEGIAKAGEIVVTDNVYDVLENRIEFEEIGEISLKGKQKLVKAYKVKI